MAALNPVSALSDARERRMAVYEQSGPAMLAAQPPFAGRPELNTVVDFDWAQLRVHQEARLSRLRSWWYSWGQHFSLLETYLLPRRGIFISTGFPTPNSMNRGAAINQAILNPTGTQAMRICAAGLMSGLMSPGRPWFKLKPSTMPRSEVTGEAALWFEEVEDRMYQVMARSNYYDSGAQMFEDLSTFGTGPQIIYEDERDVIRCYNPCPGEYFLASSNANRVESLYRMFVMTASQIVEMFGLEHCPADVQGLWRTKGASLEVERIVAHAIEPNFAIEVGGGRSIGQIKGDFTWRETYWVWGTASAQPLSIRGFKDQPHVCPRWATTSNDAYGRSVGMDVLPDIIQLQVMTARMAEAQEKMVRPPLLASMELKNEPSSILPGHVTYVSQLGSEKGMRPIYQVNPEVKEMAENMAAIEQRIRRGFFNDLFLMLEAAGSSRMTAYEVSQRTMEKLQVLGPVVERFQNEYASPSIKRIFRIMERKKLLPPLPESLMGVPLSIEYVSMMSLAQKASATAAMEQFAKAAGSLAGIYPEAKATLNAEEWLREYGTDLGVSQRVVNSREQVKALLDAEAQQAVQQQMGQEGLAAVQGAQTLSKTDVGGGLNALQLITGLGASPAGTA